MVGFTAWGPGIQALQTMNETQFGELVQGPVNLERCLKTMVAQLIKKGISPHRLPSLKHHFKHQ